MVGTKNFQNNFRRLYPNLNNDTYNIIERFFDEDVPLNRVEDAIKTLQKIKKIDNSTIKNLIRDLKTFDSDKNLEIKAKEKKSFFGRIIKPGYAERTGPKIESNFMLHSEIMNQLVAIASEILQKSKDDPPDKILDRLENHKQVKKWLDQGEINYGDLRDALDRAV